MADGERAAIRPGRCANHPGVAQAAACDLCGRPLCVACAVPVRGMAVGPECLPKVLDDAEPAPAPPAPVPPRGDGLAIAGFALVLGLSALPWSRFGDQSRLFGAWTPHWSLVAVAASAGGLALAVVFRRRPRAAALEIWVYLGLAVVIAMASYLHHHRQTSPLSPPSVVPLLAVGGAFLVAVGGLVKLATVLRARWTVP
jgi:hypothetical protein